MNNYSKQWSTATPGYLIFLIDQSSSMGHEWEDGKSFAQFTADIINRTINELIATNAAGESVKDRVFISLIGYGGNSVKDIRSGYLSSYADAPLRVDKFIKQVGDGEGGFIDMSVELPIFLDPAASGITPMSSAFSVAERLINKWIATKADCPVPVVINVSDGQPNGGNPEASKIEVTDTLSTAISLMNIETSDGNPLIFNVHIAEGQNEIQFPVSADELGNDWYANFLFKISSRVPEVYRRAAKNMDLWDLRVNSKGLISNASPETLIRFINFGSSGALYRQNF